MKKRVLILITVILVAVTIAPITVSAVMSFLYFHDGWKAFFEGNIFLPICIPFGVLYGLIIAVAAPLTKYPLVYIGTTFISCGIIIRAFVLWAGATATDPEAGGFIIGFTLFWLIPMALLSIIVGYIMSKILKT